MWTRASCDPVQSIAVSVVPASSGEGPVPAMPRTACPARSIASSRTLRRPPAGMLSVSRHLSASTAAAPAGRSLRAEAVGDSEQAGSGVGGVLVALADQALVGQSGVTDAQRLGVRRHGGVLPGQMADEEGSEIPPCGGFGLDLGPVRADLLGRRARLQRADVPDAGQGHPQAPEPGDQPGLLQLFRGVEPVAGHRVDASGGSRPSSS